MNDQGDAHSPASDAAGESPRGRMRPAPQNTWSGLLFGVGLVAFVDEAVFHQILHWHHFYDRGSADIALLSDGVFHAVSWFATIAGLFILAHLRRLNTLSWTVWTGGVLLGAGAFQLYDGVVQHKLLGLHQIRYVEDLFVYDLVWATVAVVMIVGGGVLTLAGYRRSGASAGTH